MSEDLNALYGPECGVPFVFNGRVIDVPWRERQAWGEAKKALLQYDENLVAIFDGRSIEDSETPATLKIVASVIYLVRTEFVNWARR